MVRGLAGGGPVLVSSGDECGAAIVIKYLAWQPAISYSILIIAADYPIYVQVPAHVRSPSVIISDLYHKTTPSA